MRLIKEKKKTKKPRLTVAAHAHTACVPLNKNRNGKEKKNLIVKIEKFRLKQPNERKSFFFLVENLTTFTIKKFA